MYRVAARLCRSAARAAEFEGVETVQLHTSVDKRLHVWRLHLGVAWRTVPRSVGPAIIIGKHRDDVVTLRRQRGDEQVREHLFHLGLAAWVVLPRMLRE